MTDGSYKHDLSGAEIRSSTIRRMAGRTIHPRPSTDSYIDDICCAVLSVSVHIHDLQARRVPQAHRQPASDCILQSD